MELAISNLIKIILGIVVFVIVVVGVYFFFKERIIDFFSNVLKTEDVLLTLFL